MIIGTYREDLLKMADDIKPENNYELITRPDENQKVEIYLNNQNTEPTDFFDDEDGINFLNIFGNMKKSVRVYAWVMLLTFVAGLLVPYVVAMFKQDAENVSAVITFEYTGAEDLKNPDGTDLDVGFLKSSYVVSEAIRNTHLAKNVSVNSVSQNITISRMLSEDTRQQLEVLEKINENNNSLSKPEEYIGVVNGVDYTYKTQYIVNLENGFVSGDSRIILSGADMCELLNNIIDRYELYFFNTYDTFVLPDNTMEDISIDDLDYIEWVDNINEIMSNLSTYCTSDMRAQYADYRSVADGLSFRDISRMVNLTRNVRIDYLYSYIYYNSLARDKDSLVTKLNYQKRMLDHSLNITNEKIKDGADLIASYKNSNILINRQTGSENSQTEDVSTKSISDYYNNLIIKQANLYTEKSDTELKLDNLNDKITGFTKGNISASQREKLDSEIAEVNNICRKLYDLAKSHALEIKNSEAYKNSFITEINAFYNGGFFNSANIKMILVGGLAGLLLGSVLWFGNAFITEMKEADRKSKEQGEI